MSTIIFFVFACGFLASWFLQLYFPSLVRVRTVNDSSDAQSLTPVTKESTALVNNLSETAKGSEGGDLVSRTPERTDAARPEASSADSNLLPLSASSNEVSRPIIPQQSPPFPFGLPPFPPPAFFGPHQPVMGPPVPVERPKYDIETKVIDDMYVVIHEELNRDNEWQEYCRVARPIQLAFEVHKQRERPLILPRETIWVKILSKSLAKVLKTSLQLDGPLFNPDTMVSLQMDQTNCRLSRTDYSMDCPLSSQNWRSGATYWKP